MKIVKGWDEKSIWIGALYRRFTLRLHLWYRSFTNHTRSPLSSSNTQRGETRKRMREKTYELEFCIGGSHWGFFYRNEASPLKCKPLSFPTASAPNDVNRKERNKRKNEVVNKSCIGRWSLVVVAWSPEAINEPLQNTSRAPRLQRKREILIMRHYANIFHKFRCTSLRSLSDVNESIKEVFLFVLFLLIHLFSFFGSFII